MYSFQILFSLHICFLSSTCLSSKQNGRLICSALLWSLGAWSPEAFWSLGFYSRDPKGDVRPSAGSYPEQDVSRMPNTPRDSEENTRQGHRVYLQPILTRNTKGSAQNQKQAQLLQAMSWQNISTSLRISITELLWLRWAAASPLSQITMLLPTLESSVFVTERLLGSFATIPEFLLLFLFTEVQQGIEYFTS